MYYYLRVFLCTKLPTQAGMLIFEWGVLVPSRWTIMEREIYILLKLTDNQQHNQHELHQACCVGNLIPRIKPRQECTVVLQMCLMWYSKLQNKGKKEEVICSTVEGKVCWQNLCVKWFTQFNDDITSRGSCIPVLS